MQAEPCTVNVKETITYGYDLVLQIAKIND